MEEKNIIDLKIVFRKVLNNKKLYAIVLSVTFVLSSAYTLSIPRSYTTDTKVAPEINLPTEGGLSSIASSFGIDLGSSMTTDAISPLLYPDLMDDNGFIAKLFSIKVVSQDGTIKTSYYDYLKKHTKQPWWSSMIGSLKKMFSKQENGTSKKFNPYILSRADFALMSRIRDNVKVSCDKKTSVITISVTDQDALICKIVADSVRYKYQNYITNYRTTKARYDVDYYQKLANEAKSQYEKSRRLYASYSDANTDVSLPSLQSKINDLENDMQLRLNSYTAMNTQLEAARAKLQERTPAFTILQGAMVPVRATHPKRMIFVIGMLFMAFFGLTLWICRNELHIVF